MKMYLMIAAVALAGCATPQNDGEVAEFGAGPCDAAPAQSLIGDAVTGELGQRAMRMSGARVFRWIPPDSAVTMDFRPDRLNVEYDRDNRVTDIRCG